ncbi:hypothetical protein CUJ83_10895 [Methanocella sp. CWC-04]|uniref:Uncharacterized protein n=1 Tax=Methanooceanicella nereidis TaxID=2052831 RepID=A0AAP2REU4_9EURY|nr:hypothetical protein [Methanocella sp. CWC-04]MCD1295506.1 hypothetical protein [Methanocella sp. CWC-04]
MERHDKSARITCTIGKVTIYLRKDVERDTLASILLSFSKVDSTLFYEYETICPYSDINRYRMDDYVVVSYSKSDEGYKTIFNVPFSRKKALRRLAISIIEKLKAADTDLSLLWDGNEPKINQLFEELSACNSWRLQVIEANKEN